MHEAGLLASAVSALTTASEGRPVTTVSIALAPGVDPDAAAAAWQAAAAGLPLAGAGSQRTAAPELELLDWG